MLKKLLILSGKGGTGKTTTSAAFIRFSRAGAFADCDVDAPNLHLVEELEGEPERYVYVGSEKAWIDPELCAGCGKCREVCRFDAIRTDGNGKCTVSEYGCEGCGVCAWACPRKAITMQEDVAGSQEVYTGSRTFSTAELKMGRGNSGKLVSSVKLALYKNTPPETELAIIDGSPGIGCPVIASISGVDQVLIVAEPSLSGLSDLQRIVFTARSFQTHAAVCVNKWDVSPEQTEAIQAFCRENDVPFVGCVPFDPAASAAINAGRSLADVDCPARDALRQVYGRVMELMGLPEYAKRA